MRDIAVLLILLGSMAAAFRAPWLGVLALAVFSYLNPHTYAWGFIASTPVYLMLFLAVLAAFLFNGKDRQPLPKDWRVPAFFLLWFDFFLTTTVADVPPAAWPKLIEVSKIYLPMIFTLWLINTRQKLFYLIITIAGSIGLVAAKGGVWAIAHGFSERVYGPPTTQFAGNNEFAIATLMIVPLIILWLRETADKRLRYALMASVPLCYAAALSSFSRGALLTMAVLTTLLLWHSKRKWLAVPILAVGAVLALQALPDKWFGRMSTIETYEEDTSAQGRLEAWRDGIRYALQHPIAASGFNGWKWVTKRDWHSAYVESLAEHGFPGFILWMSLLYGSMLSLTRLPKKTRHIPELKWVENYAYMLRASLAAYATGSLFLGITYWDLLYHVIFISVLVKQFALRELAEYEARQDTVTDSSKPLQSPAPAFDQYRNNGITATGGPR